MALRLKNYNFTFYTEQADVTVTLYICIRQICGSNVDQVTGYSDLVICGSSESLQAQDLD
jgi:hypothetical protein